MRPTREAAVTSSSVFVTPVSGGGVPVEGASSRGGPLLVTELVHRASPSGWSA